MSSIKIFIELSEIDRLLEQLKVPLPEDAEVRKIKVNFDRDPARFEIELFAPSLPGDRDVYKVLHIGELPEGAPKPEAGERYDFLKANQFDPSEDIRAEKSADKFIDEALSTPKKLKRKKKSE